MATWSLVSDSQVGKCKPNTDSRPSVISDDLSERLIFENTESAKHEDSGKLVHSCFAFNEQE